MKTILLLLLGLGVSCHTKTVEPPVVTTDPTVVFPKNTCASSLQADKPATQLQGLVGYRKDVDMYFINVYLGGIDSSLSGLVCNMPDAFKTTGKKVIFDGAYFTDANLPSPQLGGETMRYLTLTSIKLAP